MNAVSILSAATSSPSTGLPSRSRSNSTSNLIITASPIPDSSIPSIEQADFVAESPQAEQLAGDDVASRTTPRCGSSIGANEDTPLLADHLAEKLNYGPAESGWSDISRRFGSACVGTIRIVVATISAPFTYIFAFFFDADGQFSPLLPLISAYRVLVPSRKVAKADLMSEPPEKMDSLRFTSDSFERNMKRPSSIASASSLSATDSELDEKTAVIGVSERRSSARSSRSSSPMSSGDELSPARRSIRIKLHNDEMIRRKRQLQNVGLSGDSTKEEVKDVVAASLKSPSSPGLSKLTKFPRIPAPPRPLIPRRQPSYTNVSHLHHHRPHQKTLIIDLDETLIHSHSKGGRFATGHMVEVKIQQSFGNQLGPQIPILYYVHKRPHCDEFLRKVSKWYNLVIFTASVQEYADPVIDWLELERSYFSARYYRQHCTNRNGAYIKDLSQVEPDLSKVMIVDNSPVSYIFHEDNAIPIEGWISDPTDNDLLNLVPILEGLSHVTDVRALLALRLGQPSGDGA